MGGLTVPCRSVLGAIALLFLPKGFTPSSFSRQKAALGHVAASLNGCAAVDHLVLIGIPVASGCCGDWRRWSLGGPAWQLVHSGGLHSPSFLQIRSALFAEENPSSEWGILATPSVHRPAAALPGSLVEEQNLRALLDPLHQYQCCISVLGDLFSHWSVKALVWTHPARDGTREPKMGLVSFLLVTCPADQSAQEEYIWS